MAQLEDEDRHLHRFCATLLGFYSFAPTCALIRAWACRDHLYRSNCGRAMTPMWHQCVSHMVVMLNMLTCCRLISVTDGLIHYPVGRLWCHRQEQHLADFSGTATIMMCSPIRTAAVNRSNGPTHNFHQFL